LKVGSPSKSGKNTDRTTIYTSGKTVASIVKPDEYPIEEEKRKFSTKRVSDESVNFRSHTDIFGAKSYQLKTPEKKDEEAEVKLTPPHTGKKTNWPGIYIYI
jgi:hypothetical protein